MSPEQLADLIASAVEGDYPEATVEAYVGSNPREVWVVTVDADDAGARHEFRLTVEEQL